VVIQEIFGVNTVMRGITDSLAAEGYVALCPDLFWRQEPGVQLTDQTEDEWARAFDLFNGFDLDKGIDDLRATIKTFRGLEECTGKIATVGFCLGGRLAFLTATRTGADASVSYYGVKLDELKDETVNCPCLLHVATEDEFVPKEKQTEVHAALHGNPKVEIYYYEGQKHAFARAGGNHFDQDPADLARERTLQFFKTYLI